MPRNPFDRNNQLEDPQKIYGSSSKFTPAQGYYDALRRRTANQSPSVYGPSNKFTPPVGYQYPINRAPMVQNKIFRYGGRV